MVFLYSIFPLSLLFALRMALSLFFVIHELPYSFHFGLLDMRLPKENPSENANSAKHETVSVPASNMKKSIAQILVDEGYIKGYKVIEDGKQGVIKVTLKYTDGKTPVITGLRRVSKPGLRIYSNAEDMPKVMKGLGIAIISTSKGVMTDREARKQHIGGEVLAYIW